MKPIFNPTVLQLVGLAALIAFPAPDAVAEPLDFELTPYGGYSFGGTFEDEDSDIEIDVGDDASYGLIFNVRQTANTQYEFIYARQETTADTSEVALLPAEVDLDIEHLQIGGTYVADGDLARPYVAMTIGGSRFSPDFSGGDSDTFFSFSIGAGLTFRPVERLGLRLEARAWGTLIDSDSRLFCESGPDVAQCAIALDGTVFWQVETFAGVVFRF